MKQAYSHFGGTSMVRTCLRDDDGFGDTLRLARGLRLKIFHSTYRTMITTQISELYRFYVYDADRKLQLQVKLSL